MFKVRHIKTGKIYTVYYIIAEDNGNSIYFLIYDENHWAYKNCREFKPNNLI